MTENSLSERAGQGVLWLLPNALGDEESCWQCLPSSVATTVKGLDGLIAESEKSGRRYLKRFAVGRKVQEVPLALFNEHTPLTEIDFLLDPMAEGQSWGLLSDAGLPCVADPGDCLVRRARARGIGVKALGGVSSIFLALMLSGFPGQRFAFHGYLSRSEEERRREIKTLEKESKKQQSTQLFIEAPYRNGQMMKSLLSVLEDDTWLGVAMDLTSASEEVLCRKVSAWKRTELPPLDKRPCLFLLAAVK